MGHLHPDPAGFSLAAFSPSAWSRGELGWPSTGADSSLLSVRPVTLHLNPTSVTYSLCPWASSLAFLDFNFLTYEMEITLLSTSRGGHECSLCLLRSCAKGPMLFVMV